MIARWDGNSVWIIFERSLLVLIAENVHQSKYLNNNQLYSMTSFDISWPAKQSQSNPVKLLKYCSGWLRTTKVALKSRQTETKQTKTKIEHKVLIPNMQLQSWVELSFAQDYLSFLSIFATRRLGLFAVMPANFTNSKAQNFEWRKAVKAKNKPKIEYVHTHTHKHKRKTRPSAFMRKSHETS